MVLSPFHSAEARATVNEHVEIAKKKEMSRVSAQGVSARWYGKSTSPANQNAGSEPRGPLIVSGKRNWRSDGFEDHPQCEDGLWVPLAWQDIRLQALEALGRGGEAQAFRGDCFERTLSDSYLGAFLKRLPDFDEIEAEERAMAHAKACRSLLAIL